MSKTFSTFQHVDVGLAHVGMDTSRKQSVNIQTEEHGCCFEGGPGGLRRRMFEWACADEGWMMGVVIAVVGGICPRAKRFWLGGGSISSKRRGFAEKGWRCVSKSFYGNGGWLCHY